MKQYMEDRAALEMKYSDLCKPLYEERGNVAARCLDDKIRRIHKEGGGEKEEDGSKGDGNNGNNEAGEGDERVGDASLEEASDNNEIFGAISSWQVTTTTNTKASKEDNDKERRMVVITQFWVCTMGHMEAVAELITERVIDCLDHLTDVNCWEFEDGTGFELRFTFDIKTNE